MFGIKGRIIVGDGVTVIEDGLVVVEEERIIYAGEEFGYTGEKEFPVYQQENGTIMPGMIDCHAHLVGNESMNYEGTTEYDAILTAAHDMGLLVDAGITGVRDMSRFSAAFSRAVERGVLRGPKVFPGSRVMSVTAGHADEEIYSSIEELNEKSLIGYIVDGKEGCIRGVRQQFREGAKFIKVCATGGVSSSVDHPNDIQFSREELEAIVEEAARRGSYVAAHCTGLAGTKQAIEAGVHSIEHGVNLDQECVEKMKQKDITLVSTCTIPLNFSSFTGVSPEMMKRGLAAGQAVRESYQRARKANVRLAMGTDYSNSKGTPYLQIGKELESICQCGYTEMEAITAATRNGAFLMNQEETTGTVEVGKKADLIFLQGNPLERIDVLGTADHITHVWIDGRCCK